MNLKNIVTTGMIIGTGLVSCKKLDMPITPELQAKLDSIKAHDSMIIAQQELQHQKDIIATLQPIPEERIIQQDSIIQDSVIRQNIRDTLMTTPSDDRTQPSDSISGKQPLDHTPSTKTQDILQPTKASGPQVSEGIEQILETKNTISILDKERDNLISNIIDQKLKKETSDIQYDRNFITTNFKNIFMPYFKQHNKNIIFVMPNKEEHQKIDQTIEKILQHIKERNPKSWLLKFAGKNTLKSYIRKKLSGMIYKGLVSENNFIYTGEETQFTKDLQSLLDH